MKLINALLLVVFLTTAAAAQQPIQRDELRMKRTAALVEPNIVANLTGGNVEIQASTIQLIIELTKAEPKRDLDYAVIPLMNLLKTSNRPEIRILSALGLYHLDSEIGKYAVSRRVEFDDSERVAKMCKRIAAGWQTGKEISGNGFAYTEVDKM